MAANFADRLLAAIDEKGSPVCVGLDPVFDRLPEELARQTGNPIEEVETLGKFCREVIDIVAPIVPAVKIQSAYFEVYGDLGVNLYHLLVGAAQQQGLVVIGDVKRNDIGSTAQAYAQGHLAGLMAADAVTVNGYFGADGLQPFIDTAAENARGVFVLVRTSNPSAPQVQDVKDAAGRCVYEHVAEMVASLGAAEPLVGDRGYSCVGAVVGATYPDEARKLRELMPQQLFLIPGYGAQGASAADCAASFAGGVGGIVNASRSVLYAHSRDEYAQLNWREAVEAAARAFADDIRKAVGLQTR